MKTNEFKEIVKFHKNKYIKSEHFWEALIRELELRGFLTTGESQDYFSDEELERVKVIHRDLGCFINKSLRSERTENSGELKI